MYLSGVPAKTSRMLKSYLHDVFATERMVA